MRFAGAALATALAMLAAGRAGAQQDARWSAFEEVRLGGWVDDALARGGSCRAAMAIRELDPDYDPAAFAAFAFGLTIPHAHRRGDSTAVAAALANASACRVPLYDDRAVMLVLAFDRKVAAVVVSFDGAHPMRLTVDSVRSRAWAAWGRPTHHAPTLDTWSGDRYRAYVVVQKWGRTDGDVRPIMVSLPACAAFDRHVHRAGAGGTAEAC